MSTDCPQQLTFCEMGRQQVTVDFQGGQVVTDTGLLPIRLLDKELGVLATLAQRLPDPRAQKLVTHTREALLTQEVYQILAGYADRPSRAPGSAVPDAGGCESRGRA